MPKVLLVFVPAFLLLTLLSTALLLEYGRAQARDALAARIGALTGRVALALGVVTRGPAQPDPKLLRSLLAAFSGEAAFLCAEVTRPDGTRLAAWPAIGCDALDQPSTETWLMVPTDHGVPPLALRLRYTDDPLREDIARLGLLLALGGTASFAIALLALWLAHRLWLGPPIKRLLASIRAGAEAGVRRPVQWTSGDEMGRIVAAYNGLLAREDSREAALVDINERLETRVRRRTLELQSSEARLRAIIDISADGIVTTDARGTILSVNGAAMEMFAQAASILVGQNLTMLFGSGGEIGALLAARPRMPISGEARICASPGVAPTGRSSRSTCMSRRLPSRTARCSPCSSATSPRRRTSRTGCAARRTRPSVRIARSRNSSPS